jgi:ABC-type nitrate/sulfonate/bicarbonate transport system substrate-binding protein
MMRLISRLFVASLSVLLLSPAAGKAVDDIKIASTGPGVSTLPLEIASRKGFFRDEGLAVLTITMRTNIAVNALLTRNVDYATPSTSIVKAATAGLPVKLLAVLLGRPDYFLTVRKDIKSVKDLKGKRIAIGSFGGVVVSDGAVKVLIDQSLLELKSKDAVPLDKVRNWSFAEHARRGLEKVDPAR